MDRKLHMLALATTLVGTAAPAAEPVELSEHAFRSRGAESGIVILQVNWGRKWHCGTFENAQLEKLGFSLSSQLAGAEPVALHLETSSKLTAQDNFVPYAFIVQPGKYLLTSFDVKVARSVTDVQHIVANEGVLVVNGDPVGGAFEVS